MFSGKEKLRRQLPRKQHHNGLKLAWIKQNYFFKERMSVNVFKNIGRTGQDKKRLPTWLRKENVIKEKKEEKIRKKENEQRKKENVDKATSTSAPYPTLDAWKKASQRFRQRFNAKDTDYTKAIAGIIKFS